MAYAYLFLYSEETLRTKDARTVLSSGVRLACYVPVYITSGQALGALYLAFDWCTGGETAFRLQAIALTLFAGFSSVFVATRRF